MSCDLQSIRGILFDLWNTLVHTRYEPNPMILIARALGIAEQPGWRKVIERGMMTRPFLGIREALPALEREAGSSIGAAAREALVRAWNEASAATELYDDVMPALDALAPRYRLGIISNTQSFDLDFLRSRGLSARVRAVCLSCHEGRLKPDPLFFAAAASRLGLEPAGILMIGDNAEDDVVAAVRSGFRALHLVRRGGAGPAPGAPGTIPDLSGLSTLLASGRSDRA